MSFFNHFCKIWKETTVSFSQNQNKFSKFPRTFPRILLLVSGGADSTCLLHCLYQVYKGEQQVGLGDIHVLHVNYKLRGEESDEDASFVKSLCQELNVLYHEYEIDLAKQKGNQKGNIQALARKIRYERARKIQQEKNIDFVVTAHHLNDELENIFYKIVHGQSPFSLISDESNVEESNTILRPLKEFTKKEILHWVKENHIFYREDKSNHEAKYTRNKIRLDILPKLEEHFPNWENGLKLFTHHLRDLKSSWGKLLEQQSCFVCKGRNIFFEEDYFETFSFSEHTTLIHHHLKKHYPECRFSYSEINEIAKQIYYHRDKQKEILIKNKISFDYSYGLFSLALSDEAIEANTKYNDFFSLALGNLGDLVGIDDLKEGGQKKVLANKNITPNHQMEISLSKISLPALSLSTLGKINSSTVPSSTSPILTFKLMDKTLEKTKNSVKKHMLAENYNQLDVVIEDFFSSSETPTPERYFSLCPLTKLTKEKVFYHSKRNIFNTLKKKKIPAQLRKHFYTLSSEGNHYGVFLILPKGFDMPL